jgi:deoxycytidine triphosphate deaminase
MLQRTSIHAALSGSTICSAAGLTATGHAPVMALCRTLIDAGYDRHWALEVYRRGTLALRVRSIGQAVRLTVEECSDGRPRFRSYRPRPSEGSSLIAQKAASGS